MRRNRKRFGDRKDGRLLRSINPFYKIIPYIMRSRVDAQNFFEDKIDIGKTEAFIREKRNDTTINIGFLHIIIAAMVRTISLRPGLNRFIAGQKIFARNEILISLALKKELLEGSPETTIKMKFEPTDTLFEIAAKINDAVLANKKADENNDTDKTARIIMMCPRVIVRFLVWLIRGIDYLGFLPKFLIDVSPFHTSVFITDLGSLGIQPIYHHLYEFGTTSLFVAFGAKYREKHITRDNNIVERKYVSIKIVTDERTVDGHYYASAFKLFKSLMQNPERLESSLKEVIEDVG